jgi:L-ascorbate metabolism protein UlaG (beta-lactamase superfamily)
MAHNYWRFPHTDRGRFASYPGEKTDHTFWRVVSAFARLLLCRQNKHVPDLDAWVVPQDPSSQHIYQQTSLPNDVMISWIGHATFLLHVAGKTILTDPVFGSISYFFTFQRLTPPGIALENLPPIDVVLISHNHPDHMDEVTLQALKKAYNPLFLVPKGDKFWFTRRGFKRVEECMWWDKYPLSRQINITFLPAIHWSRRGLFDHNRSLWGGWMIEAQVPETRTIYFAGDTAYGTHFRAIADSYPSIDAALLPISPAEPRALMHCSHLNPEEAGKAFLDLSARCMIPMHWGAFRLGTEPALEPIHRLIAWWQAHQHRMENKHLSCLKMGESLVLSADALRQVIAPLQKQPIQSPPSP